MAGAQFWASVVVVVIVVGHSLWKATEVHSDQTLPCVHDQARPIGPCQGACWLGGSVFVCKHVESVYDIP